MAQSDARPHPSRMKTTPIPVPRTRRVHEERILTSFQPGYAVPVYARGLLREDQATRIDLRLTFTQSETVELLVNAVNVRALAYLVPFSADGRFDGSMDQFNRSYMKQPMIDGGNSTPFINPNAYDATNGMPVLRKLGIHLRHLQPFNNAYVAAYNQIFNWRCKNRSADLDSSQRSEGAVNLAPAFWNHQAWAQVVPDFDQASIEGEVPLTFGNNRVSVTGIGIQQSTLQAAAAVGLKETGKTATTNGTGWMEGTVPPAAAGQTRIGIVQDPARAGWPAIYAELAESGATISLANIEMARKTQAFALLRKQYNGLEDDYIMDMLMNGLTVPDQDLMNPILLADRSTVMGMAKRYASDGASLTESVTNGGTFLDLRLRTPRIPTGGTIMVIVEVVPEQLFERQADPFVTIMDQDKWPEFMRDTLDSEKVDIVTNEEVDIAHSTPASTFGYTYLNEKWARSIPRVGGKFYRPNPDGAFDADRQRIWAVETLNPTLSRDFYLCGTVNLKPFVDQVADAYEVVIRGTSVIEGNTVFGRPLLEGSDDYNAILDEAPDNPQVPVPPAVLTGAESAAEAGVTATEE